MKKYQTPQVRAIAKIHRGISSFAAPVAAREAFLDAAPVMRTSYDSFFHVCVREIRFDILCTRSSEEMRDSGEMPDTQGSAPGVSAIELATFSQSAAEGT